MTVLDDILASVREDLVERQAQTGLAELQALGKVLGSLRPDWSRLEAANADEAVSMIKSAGCGSPIGSRATTRVATVQTGRLPCSGDGVIRSRSAPRGTVG